MLGRRLVLIALAGAAACDVPTEAPRWETTWQVSGEALEWGVAGLLPSGVEVNGDSSAFLIEVPDTAVVETLAGACAPCGPWLDLSTPAPKPEFEDTLGVGTTLPTDLRSAVLVGGTFDVVLEHSFGFDPLNPSPGDPDAPTGHVIFRVASAGTTIATDSIDGADVAFGPGTPLRPDLAVRSPVTVENDLLFSIRLYSPEGDSVRLASADTVGVRVGTSQLQVSEITVSASTVDIEPIVTEFDFTGVDDTVVERVRGGALILDVENPFDVAGTLDIAFQLPGLPDPTGSVEVRQGSFEEEIELSGAELRAILGTDAPLMVISGVVSAPAGAVTMTADQVLGLDTSFRLVLLVGGTPEG